MHWKDLFEPSGFATLVFLAGLASAMVRSSRHWAAPLLGASATIFIVFSTGLAANVLMGPLESSFPALGDPQRYPQARVIAVLTGYAIDDPEIPLSSRLNASSAFRVIEAASIWTLRPDCTIVVTGSTPAAQLMARQLRALGIPDDFVKVDLASVNTAASSVYLESIAGSRPLFLVTSAGHMRRAVRLLRSRGVIAIPAPTDFRLAPSDAMKPWTTSPTLLQASDLAVHEYLALAWYWLKEFS